MLCGLYRNEHPAPESDPDKRVEVHEDGARFEYDREAHRYSITLPEDGEMVITIGTTVLRFDASRIKGDANGGAGDIRWNA